MGVEAGDSFWFRYCTGLGMEPSGLELAFDWWFRSDCVEQAADAIDGY